MSLADRNNNAEWTQGPDKLIPADSYFSSKLGQPVNLRLNDRSATEYPPISVFSSFKKTVDEYPHFPAVAFKSNGQWVKYTYAEYFGLCVKSAKSFIKLGLGTSEVVNIIGFNSPEWSIGFLGSILAGGIGCGLYTTNTSEACEYVIRDSGSQIIVVENKKQLDKIMQCKNNGCLINKIIQYKGEVEDNYDGLVLSWNEFLEYGSDVQQELLQQRIQSQAPNKCASLIYTSGTTGSPKAVMISQDAVTFQASYTANELAALQAGCERCISYLPLSHIAGQVIDIFLPLTKSLTVYYAQPDALTGGLAEMLKDVRPTFFFGVPRVFEKIQAKIQSLTSKLTGAKASIFKFSTKAAHTYWTSRYEGAERGGFTYRIAKTLVLNKLHAQLGLDQCTTVVSGAAPITKETLDFYTSIGMPVVETFGMSELSGPHTLGNSDSNRVMSVGKIDTYHRCKIAGKDADGSGELLVYGRNVFMGYLNLEEKTAKEFDDEGWMRTGDIGKIDDGNYLYITGRIKELVITAGGENIAPVPIEDHVKAELPDLVSNCMLVGDKKKFLSLLVTLKSNVDLVKNEPLDELTHDCVSWLQTQGSKATRVTQAINNQDSVIDKLVKEGIERANEKAVSRAGRVNKFAILPRDFSIGNGELGPTLKLRRPIVHKMYASVIDEIYKE